MSSASQDQLLLYQKCVVAAKPKHNTKRIQINKRKNIQAKKSIGSRFCMKRNSQKRVTHSIR